MDALDQAFTRYCTTRDPEALGEVFDRCAARLALLAGHLVPSDRHAVEDLVQTTFLEAIRCADRFTPGRKAFPWLATILIRRAGDLRRRHRRNDVQPLPESGLPDERDDPRRRAEEREIAARVDEVLHRLPAPYREVLALRLIHGLTAAEIARALDRPAGTVHVQLHRGMERLRGLLPKGIATALAGLLGSGEAMAAARRSILEHAVAVQSAVGTAAWGIALGAGRKAAGLLGVCALAIGLTLWPRGEHPAEEPASTVTAVDLQASTQRVADPSLRTAPSASRQTRVPLEDPAPTVRFSGRVLDADSRQPIVGAALRYGETGTPPRSIVLDPSGAFDVTLEPQVRVVLHVTAPQHYGKTAAWTGRMKDGVHVDCGDVLLPSAVPTTIELRDEHGGSVRDVELRIAAPENPADAKLSDFRFHPPDNARTGSNGRTAAIPLLPGTWGIQIVGDPHRRLLFPGVVHVEPDARSQEVTLMVGFPAGLQIRGQVLGVGGVPLPKVTLRYHGREPVQSDAEGRFVLAGLEAGTVTLLDARSSDGKQLQPVGREVELEAGARDQIVVLAPPPNEPELAVGNAAQPTATRARRTASGRIVGQVEPAWLLRSLGPSEAARREAGRYENPTAQLARRWVTLRLQNHGVISLDDGTEGRFEFYEVPAGDHTLRLELFEVHGHAPSIPVLGLRPGETRELRIDLGRWQPAQVRGKITIDGAPPPPGSRLECGAWPFRVDAEGAFAGALYPGRHELVLSGRVPFRLTSAEPLHVAAGEVLHPTIDFTRRTLRVIVRSSDGRPVRGRIVSLYREGHRPAVAIASLDARGEATLVSSGFAGTRAYLRRHGDRPRVDLGPVEVPVSGEGVAEFLVERHLLERHRD